MPIWWAGRFRVGSGKSSAPMAMFWKTVLILPSPEAAITRPPAEARPRRPVTASSRPTITTTRPAAQVGMRPTERSTISAVATRSLSARGSRSFPIRVTCAPRRASQPSTMSVTAATMKSHAVSWLPKRDSATSGKKSRIGTTPVRRIVIVLGRFQMRSGPWARGERAGSPREVAMVAAIIGQNPVHVLSGLGVGGAPAVAVHGRGPRVVGRDRPAPVPVAVDERAQVAHAAVEVLLHVQRLLHAEGARRGGHELHQALGALSRDRLGVEARLRGDDGLHQRGRNAVGVGRLHDQEVVAADARRAALLLLDADVAPVVRDVREVQDALLVHVVIQATRPRLCGEEAEREERRCAGSSNRPFQGTSPGGSERPRRPPSLALPPIDSPEGFRSLSERSITLLRQRADLVPLGDAA